MKLHLTIPILLIASGHAIAQSHRGSGISGGAIGHGVSVDFVRVHWGPPDSVRLAAAILWRGSSQWSLSHGPAERAQARAAMDSAWREADRRGGQAGGTITARANAWVEFDPGGRAVSVLQHTYSAPAADSALVLLVDRVDHIGGAPQVVATTVPCAAQRDPASTPGPAGPLDMSGAIERRTDHWRGCLLQDSTVRAFVERSSAR